MDFGVAHLAGDSPLTAAGDVVGTLAYMAPEQADGKPAGPEADVYSLALTLYECWSGEHPFRRAGAAATARAIGSRARSLRRLRPDLPRELTETVDACLNPRPNHRPSLEELGTAIEDSLGGLADHVPVSRGGFLTRLSALAAAATLGGFLALHGAALP
jgi:serine/threonine protein kinase